MKRTGTVVMDRGKLKAEVIRSEACQQCRACQFGQKQSVLVELPEGDFLEGDAVELTIPEGQVGKASLIAYGVPLVLFGAGLLVGGALGLSEGLQAVVALAATAAGFVCVRLLDARIKKEKAYRPEIARCAHREDTQGGE